MQNKNKIKIIFLTPLANTSAHHLLEQIYIKNSDTETKNTTIENSFKLNLIKILIKATVCIFLITI